MKNTIILILITGNMVTAQNQKIEVHGHRGCRGILPENSLDGFRHAMDLGVDVLELDLVVNGDGELVISHEPWMNPQICTLGGKRLPQKSRISILEMTTAQMTQYDCGSAGNPGFPEQEPRTTVKPLLRELVAMVRTEYPERSQEVTFNMEIKYQKKWEGKFVPTRKDFLELFISTVEEEGISGQVILQCFDRKILKMARQRQVSFPLSYLVQNIWGSRYNLKRLGFNPDYYSPYFKLLSSKSMSRMRSRGIKVVPWTVNTTEDIRKMVDLGVDGIISDYPDRIQKALEE